MHTNRFNKKQLDNFVWLLTVWTSSNQQQPNGNHQVLKQGVRWLLFKPIVLNMTKKIDTNSFSRANELPLNIMCQDNYKGYTYYVVKTE